MTSTRSAGGGRKPLPTQLKIIRGTLEARRTNKNEPVPNTDRIIRPDELSKGAQKHWDVVIAQLIDAKIMTNIDVTALGVYCEAYEQWRDATNKMNDQGTVIQNDAGEMHRNPYFLVAQRTFENLKSMWTEFGMTPSSRSRIIATGTRQTSNKFARNGRPDA